MGTYRYMIDAAKCFSQKCRLVISSLLLPPDMQRNRKQCVRSAVLYEVAHFLRYKLCVCFGIFLSVSVFKTINGLFDLPLIREKASSPAVAVRCLPARITVFFSLLHMLSALHAVTFYRRQFFFAATADQIPKSRYDLIAKRASDRIKQP